MLPILGEVLAVQSAGHGMRGVALQLVGEAFAPLARVLGRGRLAQVAELVAEIPGQHRGVPAQRRAATSRAW